ncbi:MAG TPA: UbiX family flavin prenyltransferase [Nitrososphaerales archaeon]
MRLVIGISGASGALYGTRLLEVLKNKKIETHLIVTNWGTEIIKHETGLSVDYVKTLASKVYNDNDLASDVSSGSFKFDAMIIIPCSMKTIAGIASGYSSTLLTRVADVALKEKRKLILVPRETPLSAIHLKNMLTLSRLGVVILPAMPAFYHIPKSINDLSNHIVGKVLDQLEINHNLYKRWQNEIQPKITKQIE